MTKQTDELIEKIKLNYGHEILDMDSDWCVKEKEIPAVISLISNDKQDLLDEVKAKFMNCKGEVRRVGVQMVEEMRDER